MLRITNFSGQYWTGTRFGVVQAAKLYDTYKNVPDIITTTDDEGNNLTLHAEVEWDRTCYYEDSKTIGVLAATEPVPS